MKRIALILAPPLALALLLRLHKKRARSSVTVLGAPWTPPRPVRLRPSPLGRRTRRRIHQPPPRKLGITKPQKQRNVSGHGFTACGKTRFSIRARPWSCRNRRKKDLGFSPCVGFEGARLQSCRKKPARSAFLAAAGPPAKLEEAQPATTRRRSLANAIHIVPAVTFVTTPRPRAKGDQQAPSRDPSGDRTRSAVPITDH